MKKSRKCPKCGSIEVVKAAYQIGTSSSYRFVPPGCESDIVVQTEKYLCCECGYMEEWATDSYLRENIRERPSLAECLHYAEIDAIARNTLEKENEFSDDRER